MKKGQRKHKSPAMMDGLRAPDRSEGRFASLPEHVQERLKAAGARRVALRTLIRAAEDVALQYETATCGPDLSDSIRVFLIPAMKQAKHAEAMVPDLKK